ncbi:hypothetical protein LCDVSa138L [Lymphocystis disease virus 3]|uniref:Uncharacterized protein n=1 Tax=Lymphocystis disease virus 3 TaxID=2560566 RepID=A0A1B2RW42_9VIRU|nr:hypothetical protein BZK12_gp138 [Lymphocystis disease virus Sa]AOC55222.1 hypothetical protein LCDVSa138L [Lymphocystis disease virus 3]
MYKQISSPVNAAVSKARSELTLKCFERKSTDFLQNLNGTQNTFNPLALTTYASFKS